ncbi:MAG: PhzF family phenazine biosynthesis protein [Prolixibacteraceae bacterium]|jgi:PhzF family phenazine biosynthesis protein|nr:PhzF family phenazine biosynthesis protein [Prolixibacteraceae bacterium]MDD4756627.1 PhzF family phenazine biosynthesis protein [Prolixibacteraceae bacterium]NLO00948.1 PhzF family phenazine biosynthesis protein [Bacteroidales bacterium]
MYTIYQIDAFADKIFTGNPAAVIPLKKWLPDQLMQNIAMENNLSETAFFIPENDGFHIRWFTPLTEVNLCGHATLASAHVIFQHTNYDKDQIIFSSRSGILKGKKEGQFILLDFPASNLKKISLPDNIEQAFGIQPQKCIKGREDLMFVFDNSEEIKNLTPDIGFLKTLNARGIIVTAPSFEYDFVSRFFAPVEGIDEDPVTGSAHTMLIPYWSDRLQKKELITKQISSRGGVLKCLNKGARVEIGGRAVTFMIGEIHL